MEWQQLAVLLGAFLLALVGALVALLGAANALIAVGFGIETVDGAVIIGANLGVAVAGGGMVYGVVRFFR